MRQRIKAIETIKKVTHAMRLISMSAHTRLKRKKDPITEYMQEIRTLFTKVQALSPEWKNNILMPPRTSNPRMLIILVGSQKGLCGVFNTALINFFKQHIAEYKNREIQVIAVGKKAVEHAKSLPYKIIARYDDFNNRNMFDIAHELTDIVTQANKPYNYVHVFSNYLKTFFIQRPHETKLIPFEPEKKSNIQIPVEGYVWEHNIHEILDMLAQQLIEANMQFLLFQSLLAEQAARFISMDSSTRNANNLLEASKLEYNKLRQAKITKELTELASSFETL